MSRDLSSEGCSGWLKWLVGILIAMLAAGGGIVALLSYINPPRTPTPLPTAQPTSTAVVCFISGTVYNKDNSQPLPNVLVSYFRFTKDRDEYSHGVRSQLATTDSKGHFEADCASTERENFPLRLVLSKSGWCIGSFQTDEYIQMGQRRTAINLYVSEKFMSTTNCP